MERTAGDFGSADAGAVLVRAHLNGEANAFARLYDGYYDQLVGVLIMKTRDPGLSRELAHDTMVRALLRLDTYDTQRPLWPWLRQISVNLANDHYRRRKRETPRSPERLRLIDVDEDHAEVAAGRDLLFEALRRVPDRQREALTLCYVEDRPMAEVAAHFALRRGAFDQLMHRARASLSREYRALERQVGRIRVVWPWVTVGAAWVRVRSRMASVWSSIVSAQPVSLAAFNQAVAVTVVAVAVVAAPAGGTPAGAAPEQVMSMQARGDGAPPAGVVSEARRPLRATPGKSARTPVRLRDAAAASGPAAPGTKSWQPARAEGGEASEPPPPVTSPQIATQAGVAHDDDTTASSAVSVDAGGEGADSERETTVHCGGTTGGAACAAMDAVREPVEELTRHVPAGPEETEDPALP